LPDRTTIEARPGDLSFVTVEVVDAQGHLCPYAGNTIFLTVQGAGSLAAVGNGDATSTEPYRGNRRSAFQGRCLAVIKSDGKPGKIVLRAQADGLGPAEVIITAD
jgi:beta-galactosidase